MTRGRLVVLMLIAALAAAVQLHVPVGTGRARFADSSQVAACLRDPRCDLPLVAANRGGEAGPENSREAVRDSMIQALPPPPSEAAARRAAWRDRLWLALGLAGQLLFAGRFLIQWIASERRQTSTVPPAFWYLSLAGGLVLLAYSIHKADVVFVVGQASGLLIYWRNLWFLARRRKQAAGAAAAPPALALRS